MDSRMPRRSYSRSRSRSPVTGRTVTASHDSAPTKRTVSAVVNMLDAECLEKVTEKHKQDGERRPRLTLTIPGEAAQRGGMQGRIRSFGGDRQQFGGRNSFGDSRPGMRNRLSFNANSNFRSYGDMPGTRNTDRNGSGREKANGFDKNRLGGVKGRQEVHEVNEDRRNGSFREEDRPVQRLIDPCEVPKGKFFDHDERGSSDSNDRRNPRYREPYDPRKDRTDYRRGDRRRGDRDRDMDGSRNRDGHAWDGFGRQRSGGGGGGGGRFDRDRGRFGDRNDRGYRYGERRGSFEDRPSNKFVSPADGVWTHDLFQDEQEHDDKKDNGVVLVVDHSDSGKRRVHSDD
ncbi:hypothetical protein WR25_23479 [Diploscapter pachys]|uniref:Btz domain-containing protein n=1 Tax=Diploscapter pachys TaxID=2018661 RepID=A0A2A2L929_9BILA|nr:hypothetical protein WR25_23479 [Diploscapter pachys]